MFSLGLQRHDGPIATIGVGCWARDDAGRVIVSCPDCGGTDAITAVDQRGLVPDCFYCQTATCSFRRFLRLEGWIASRFDTSEIAR